MKLALLAIAPATTTSSSAPTTATAAEDSRGKGIGRAACATVIRGHLAGNDFVTFSFKGAAIDGLCKDFIGDAQLHGDGPGRSIIQHVDRALFRCAATAVAIGVFASATSATRATTSSHSPAALPLAAAAGAGAAGAGGRYVSITRAPAQGCIGHKDNTPSCSLARNFAFAVR